MPWSLKVALGIIERYFRTGDIPLWLKILIRLRFGRFVTPDGVEYFGFKVSFKW
jgi:hypothetical protein